MNDYTGPDGKTYKLGHFKPTNYQIGITLNGTRYLVPVVITYSSHCFTDTKKQTVLETDPWFYNTDHTGPRAFCPTRWNSSLDLPGNIDFLINQNKGCYDATIHGSYLHLRNPNAKYLGNGWYVMFKLSRADDPALVHMKIASHHFRKQLPSNVKNPKTKPFSMVLHQWIVSKPEIVETLESGEVQGSIIIQQADAQ
jgi:hypothetical protein